MSTKEKIHQLIDQIQDEDLLKAYLDLLQKRSNEVAGHLWNSLNDEEKNELLMAYDESEDPENLISHEAIKNSFESSLD